MRCMNEEEWSGCGVLVVFIGEGMRKERDVKVGRVCCGGVYGKGCGGVVIHR